MGGAKTEEREQQQREGVHHDNPVAAAIVTADFNNARTADNRYEAGVAGRMSSLDAVPVAASMSPTIAALRSSNPAERSGALLLLDGALKNPSSREKFLHDQAADLPGLRSVIQGIANDAHETDLNKMYAGRVLGYLGKGEAASPDHGSAAPQSQAPLTERKPQTPQEIAAGLADKDLGKRMQALTSLMMMGPGKAMELNAVPAVLTTLRDKSLDASLSAHPENDVRAMAAFVLAENRIPLAAADQSLIRSVFDDRKARNADHSTGETAPIRAGKERGMLNSAYALGHSSALEKDQKDAMEALYGLAQNGSPGTKEQARGALKELSEAYKKAQAGKT